MLTLAQFRVGNGSFSRGLLTCQFVAKFLKIVASLLTANDNTNDNKLTHNIELLTAKKEEEKLTQKTTSCPQIQLPFQLPFTHSEQISQA